MPFAAAQPDFNLTRPEVIFGGYQGVPYGSALSTLFDVTRRSLEALPFGETLYRLRRISAGTFYPGATGQKGEFAVEGFQGLIVGQGQTPNQGYEDWLKRFHVAFQQLYRKRPFEMNEAERQLWNVIESQIDVEQYRVSQPLVLRQEGKVCRARPFPDVIQWEDGTRERVPLNRMPAEFAGYRIGQRFEAVVHRDPLSYKILKVDYVKRLASRKMPTAKESRQTWDSLPTSESLPDTDWD